MEGQVRGHDNIDLQLQHGGKTHSFSFHASASLQDLSRRVAQELGIEEANQKILISPKPGLLRPPFQDANVSIADIAGKKITVLGSTPSQISSLNKAISDAQVKTHNPIKSAQPAKTTRQSTKYTFNAIEPLPHLKNPERSRQFLQRLANDPGIRFTMNKRHFSVGMLTELDPLENTDASHEGTTRTLGLNMNKGEKILLRLRTDLYDGYRDYKTIRNTLCHELTHNVHGDHDRSFWDLCHQIEKEVNLNDYSSGGHALSNQEYYDPGESAAPEHSWSGGSHRLGSSAGNTSRAQPRSNNDGTADPAARRAATARAAEERARRAREDQSR